ncbi:MAG: MBL fold metallo-hydrolase, partial [Oscillospiraceae bacterium]|nr:MBL fold metallo-hydrolase [Oscillospiraceae bacterium]
REFITIREGQTIRAAGLTFTVLHTPGHTPGGVCYLCEGHLFTGDTLFCGGIGRIDLGGNRKDMLASLRRLTELPFDAEVYPGHGENSTLSDERRNNPYMGVR